jgi:hypothetical protein
MRSNIAMHLRVISHLMLEPTRASSENLYLGKYTASSIGTAAAVSSTSNISMYHTGDESKS